MSKKIHISFLLDETGSMGVVKQQTISGFNEYVETLRQGDNASDVRFTLTKFDSEKTEAMCKDVKLKDVPELNDDNYRPGALTPLYDAIGMAIRGLENKVSGKQQKALLVIQTDGQENASREYTSRQIFDLIDKKKKKGWTFVFLGADQDAYLTSQQFGISRGNTMSYVSAQTAQAFSAAAAASARYVASAELSTDQFFGKEEEEGETT